MLKIHLGSVVDAWIDRKIEILAHGVNCSNGFASGVAGEIAKKIPIVKQSYHQKFEEVGWKLGDIQTVYFESGQEVLNCATQEKYGRDPNTVYASMGAVIDIYSRTAARSANSGKTIGFPLIGGGLGGLDPLKVFDQLLNIYYSDSYKEYVGNLYVITNEDLIVYENRLHEYLHLNNLINELNQI